MRRRVSTDMRISTSSNAGRAIHLCSKNEPSTSPSVVKELPLLLLLKLLLSALLALLLVVLVALLSAALAFAAAAAVAAEGAAQVLSMLLSLLRIDVVTFGLLLDLPRDVGVNVGCADGGDDEAAGAEEAGGTDD